MTTTPVEKISASDLVEKYLIFKKEYAEIEKQRQLLNIRQTELSNEMSKIQKSFDSLVAELHKDSPWHTHWAEQDREQQRKRDDNLD